MLSQAYFGITNSGVNLAVNLLILFLVVIWLALIYWTYADARGGSPTRCSSPARPRLLAVPLRRHDRST